MKAIPSEMPRSINVRARLTPPLTWMLHGLRGLQIICEDVVEVSPPFDPAGITALAGAQMMFEILCLAAATFIQRSGR
jgi:arginase family enzyme